MQPIADIFSSTMTLLKYGLLTMVTDSPMIPYLFFIGKNNPYILETILYIKNFQTKIYFLKSSKQTENKKKRQVVDKYTYMFKDLNWPSMIMLVD